MPLVFSYGSLQQEAVQMATFGRLLHGHHDALPRYEAALVAIHDPALAESGGRTHHANASFNGRSDSCVHGMVFEISDAELAAADRYEQRADYQRVSVVLASGATAWVYVHVPPA